MLTLSLTDDDDAGAPGLRAFSDSLLAERALAANAAALGLGLPDGVLGQDLYGDPARLLGGARLVLLRLPRSLAALAEVADLIAAHADPEVRIVAAGRDKHMTPAMNEVLARRFERVWASRGRQKSRVLHAAGVRADVAGVAAGEGPVAPEFAEVIVPSADGGEAPLTVAAHGAAFAGATLDPGTRLLLRYLPEMAPDAREAIDLGCGTGVLATALALARPELRVLATDVSAAAVASARATAAANGVAERVTVRREDGLAGLAPASADLIVCNPPFHSGAAVTPDAGTRLFAGARRVLRPGGELWTVYNSRLSRARELRRLVGPTDVIADDGRFTVARTTLPGARNLPLDEKPPADRGVKHSPTVGLNTCRVLGTSRST